MIRRTESLTYASELLVEMSNRESRQYVRKAYSDFWRFVAEDCIEDLRVAALGIGRGTVREWAFLMADKWLTTEEGRAFAEVVAEEIRS